MFKQSVKFGLKIPSRLGKNVRKPHGDFLTHTVELESTQRVQTTAAPAPGGRSLIIEINLR